ncbi:putative flavoprotein-like protein YCP4 [CHAIN 0] [Phytophthora infestans]|uniref:Putative flavoprotein-like protein YCP4 [CHAIN 0] n=1 Tax=Phytophthora infestans TaxID=4787 RepID=A0A833T6C5_PHYIN|nr:putative flavoprotein-like protein YCP4 [CHAIN 0] [Phytophthora infestans]KAF4130698.1 putative flavoprotein-like protein YCP4 [CHAIN 0] [Phytophthora infestans]
MTKVVIVLYSTFGHVAKMASAIQRDVLDKRHALPKSDFPVVTPDVLKNADGVMLGLSTRMMPAQMKALFDARGDILYDLISADVGRFIRVAKLTRLKHEINKRLRPSQHIGHITLFNGINITSVHIVFTSRVGNLIYFSKYHWSGEINSI